MPGKRVRRLVASVLVLLTCLVVGPAMRVEAAPTLSVVLGGTGEVLQGGNVSYTLRACNPFGPDTYNVTFRQVLPVGLSYVSTSGTATAPMTYPNSPAAGQTTLVWNNVSDLQTNVCQSIGISVAVDPVAHPVGSVFATTGQAYSNTDPRVLVKFLANGTVNSSTAPGSGTSGSVNTTVIPYQLRKSGGGELLRGVHTNSASFTLTIENNLIAPTGAFTVDDFLPPDLELLGCTTTDNTPAGAVEYTGSARLSPSACGYVGALGSPTVTITTMNGSTPVANSAGTVFTPPIGTTWVRWTFPASGPGSQLAAGGTQTITYRAGIPLRENRPFTGIVPTPASGQQGANLGNNTGPWTEEAQVAPSTLADGAEQAGTNSASAGAAYSGPRVLGAGTFYSDTASASFQAEDLAMDTSASGSVVHAALITSTLTTRTSEYRRVNGMTITDRLPNGTCPEGMPVPADPNCTSGNVPVITLNGTPVVVNSPFHASVTLGGDGTYAVTWDSTVVPALASVAPNTTVVVTFTSRVRPTYQNGQAVLTNDDFTNYSYVNGQIEKEAPGDPAPGNELGSQAEGESIQDDASAGVAGISVQLDKKAAIRSSLPNAMAVSSAVGVDCAAGTVAYTSTSTGGYATGDIACFKLRAFVPVNISASSVKVTDFLPNGMRYIPGSARTTAANTVTIPAATAPVAASPEPDVSGVSLTDGGGTLEWSIGSIDNIGETFEVTVAVELVNPETATAGDLTDNLLKLTSVNTAGQVFAQRVNTGIVWSMPLPKVRKGVDTVERPANASPVYPGDYSAVFSSTGPDQGDGIAVQAFDHVTYRIDLHNTGDIAAKTVTVWDRLPSTPLAITCADVVSASITGGGSCVAAPFPHIDWTVPTVAVSSAVSPAVTLRYRVAIPDTVNSGAVETNTAGITSYQNPINTAAGTFTYVPTSNLDTTRTSNLSAVLNDTVSVTVVTPTPTKTVTLPTCVGSGCIPDVRIGDPVKYRVTVDLPRTKLIDAHVLDAVPSNLTNVTWTAKLERGATDITVGNLLATSGSGNSIDVGLLDPFDNTSTVGETAVLTLDIDAAVADAVANTDGFDIVNTAAFSSRPTIGGIPVVRTSPNATVNVTVPNVTVAKAIASTTPARVPQRGVLPGDVVTYEITLANTGTGRAFEVKANDVVPVNLTPNPASILIDGAAVAGPDSASFSGQTLSAQIDQIAPGSSKKVRYTATVDTPVTPSPLLTPGLTNTVTLTEYRTLPTNPSNPNIRVITPNTTGSRTVYPLSKVGDLVWKDVNGNGVRDAGDNGLVLPGGVTVTLSGTDILGNAVNRVTTSDPLTGAYLIDTLMPSDATGYQIVFTRPPGLYFSPRAVATPLTSDTDSDALIASGQTTRFVVLSNENITTVDAGLYEPAVIGNFVFLDADADGIQDVGEPGLAGANVLLTDAGGGPVADGLGNPVGSQLTSSTGAYSFGALPPGTYQVRVVPPIGYTLSPSDRLSDDTVDSDVLAGTGRSSSVSVIPGETNNTVDAGFFRAITIGDRLWIDRNSNGTRDAADTAGVSGAMVTLEGAGLDAVFGTADDLSGSTTTAGGGAYSFSKTGVNNTGSPLPPGDYRLTFALPATYEFSPASVGAPKSSNNDSDANETTGVTATFTMNDNEATINVDAGVWKRVTLGDFVWEDLNANGIQEISEPPVSAVGIELLDASGASFGVPITASTDAFGAWTIPNIRPGDYRVRFTPPVGAGWNFSPAGAGVTATDSNANPATGSTATFALVSGTNDLTIDAGLYKYATLGDLVWEDVNGNGVRDVGDDGVDGVTVRLLDNSGNPVLNAGLPIQTTTAGGGIYTFGNVVPGTYRIGVVKPSGWAFTVLNSTSATDLTDSDIVRATGVSDPMTLISDQTDNSVDGGMYRTSSIGDLVWVDTNGSGVRDAGENGVAGAVLRLVDALGVRAIDASGTSIADQTTTGSGAYAFTNLSPGSYRVIVVTRPSGYQLTPALVTINGATPTTDSDVDTTTNQTALIPLISGAAEQTIDVGMARPVSIGDQVWVDTNADGARGGSETAGVNGATAALRGAGLDGAFGTADDVTGSVTTNASGIYTFTRAGINNTGALLAPGAYQVTFGLPFAWEFTTASAVAPLSSDTDSDASTTAGPTFGRTGTITLTEGQATTNLDAGMFQRATVGDRVWEDLNANGIQDSGEPGISGATVELLDATGASFTIPVTTTTDSSGLWSIANLRPADYRVSFTAPTGAGWQPTPTGFGATATNSDADVITGITPVITLDSGVSNTGVDAGYYRFASIGNYVWEDTDGNGAQDVGEPPVAGATVTLTGTTGSGVLITPRTTTTTSGTGVYQFSNVVPGVYVVTVTVPTGMVVTLRDVSTATDTTDSDANPSGASPSTTLRSNEANPSIDTGLIRPATIGDRVWHDTNGDGIQTAGEDGIAGVTVRLVDAANNPVLDASGSPVNATTTDANGNYSFANLRPGTYRVLVTAPMGYVFTDSFVASGGATTSTDSNANATGATTLVSLISDETNSTIDTGLFRGVVIGDQVWDDTNADGTRQVTETTGVGGVTVRLLNSSSAVIATVTTASDGTYSFTRSGPDNSGALLREGDYRVEFVRPSGYLPSPPSTSSPRASGLDSDADLATGRTAVFGVPDGVTTTHIDAGFFAAASVGDRVWDDTNANGIQDSGEPGLDGVTVELVEGTAVIRTAVTSGGGTYVFDNLVPGTYRVHFTTPSGWTPSPIGRGSGATNSDASLITGTTPPFTLQSGQSPTDVDAGFFRTAGLGDRVWEDLNGNGVQDIGEPGVANVRVRLLDAAGVQVADAAGDPITQLTTGSGNYRFDGLAPGIYRIRIDAPSGFTLTAANVGPNTTDSDLNKTSGISGSTTLGSGEVNLTLDAGIVNLPIISGYVYVDADNDGIRDTGEAPIVGAVITLTGVDVFGTSTTRATNTGADGYYQFTGLEASSLAGYSLTETQPSGYLDGRDTVGTAGGSLGGPIPSRDVLTGIVVGSSTNSARNNFGELLAGGVSGSVYVDITDDGNRQVGEPGIAAVSIALTGTDDLGNVINRVTTTAADGSFAFTGLRPGIYVVTEVTQPASYVDGAERAGTAGGTTTTNDQISSIAIASGTMSTGNLFGEKPPVPVAYTSISGAVRIDPNTNGTRDTGENGTVAGVTITLRDGGGLVVVTTTTDVNGNYSFAGIPVGDYSVIETQPTGYGSSSPNTLSVTAPVGGLSGQDFFDTTSSLAGQVFVDADNDGIDDSGEQPIGGITIRVTGIDVNGRSVNLATDTSVDGTWKIDGLVAGLYTVTEPTQPTGYGDGRDAIGTLGGTRPGNGIGTDSVTAITVGVGVNGTGYDFGEISSTASVSGNVYLDRNRDSVRDAGVDSPLAGVVVVLRNTSGDEIARTTTGNDGTYRFDNLVAGADYRIDQVTPAGLGRSENPTTIAVNGLAATGVTAQNFGDTVSTISGFVYVDANDNGVRNAGETAISGVTITLSGVDANGNTVSRTTVSNASGAWTFTDLLSGSYSVVETQPPSYADGQDTAGTVGGTVADDRIVSIAMGAGIDASSYLFGERQNTTSLSGSVFIDASGNGVIDSGDTGLGGVSITLRDAGNNVIATALTIPDGTYSFTNLVPGTYSVTETQPNGYGSSTPNVFPTVTVPLDGVTNINFGETTGSLAGRVYVATTNDGVRQVSESTGISGVTITLTGIDVNGPVSRITSTDATGAYQFINLLAGTYAVSETQPGGYTDAIDSLGTINATAQGTLGNDNITAITMPAAGTGIGYDFAEGQAAPTGAFVSGVVYLDAGANGSLDAGDTGLGGWTIELLNNAGSVVASVTSAADGTFRITNLGTNNTGAALPAGVYSIRETQKATHGSSTPNLIASLNIPPTGRSDQNFGETLSSLGGRVVIDTNDDGIADPTETGVSGVVLTLTGTDALGAALSRTTTTGVDGSYVFRGVPSGSYTVTETQPGAYDDGREHVGTVNGSSTGALIPTDAIGSIVLPPGVVSLGVAYDFGELLRPVVTGATLTGTVFLDRNRSGSSPDSGEPGLGGVTLTLFDALNNLVGTTTTAPDGTYAFAGLRPGTHRIVETQPIGLGTTTPNTLSSLTVLAGGLANVNFGEIGASLAGQVYVDTNDDGVRQTPAEVAVAGVIVTLSGTDANGAAVNRTTNTAVDGTYRFDDLLAGTYGISETQPAAYLDGLDAVGAITGPNPSANPGTLGNDAITAIALPIEGVGTGYDFGEKVRPTPAGTAFLEGVVWVDANSSATIDSGEAGLAGVRLTLRNPSNVVIDTMLTGPDGRYRFTNLAPGTYSVVETQPSGYTSTTPDSIPSAVVPLGGLSNQNFGERLTTGTTGTTTSLRGSVWIDRNANGSIDTGEAGLGGVILTLLDSTGSSVSTTVTKPDGFYAFTNLAPGTYSVSEAQPPAYGSSTPNILSALSIPPVGLSGVNFGETTASVTGFVYVDANNDGVKAPTSTERGIGGVSVNLIGVDVNGVPVSASTTTGPDGSFVFTGLPAATYGVIETQPAGYGDGIDTAGSTGVAGADSITAIVVNPGGVSTGHLFGEQETLPTTVFVRGTVFLDRDRNSSAGPGDGVIVGVAVQLRDGSGVLIGTSITGADGTYLFTGLTPGAPYTVTEVQPIGFGSSLRSTNAEAITAPASGGISEIDFGDTLSSIAGSVFDDVDGNGERTSVVGPAEPGISGVTVTLNGTTAAGSSVTRTTATSPDGSYAFTDLPAGIYTITETQPSGWSDGQDAAGTVGGGVGNDVIADISLPLDTQASGYTFGERVPSAAVTTTISGVVFVDRGADGLTANGLRDTGEPGVLGVTLVLRDSNGAEVARTTTLGDGSYSFPNVAPGTYTVEEIQPLNYGSSTPNTLSSLTVPATGLTGVNFGETLGAIIGIVYSDADNNGVQDSGEPGIGGVTITLTGKDRANNAVTRTATTLSDGTYSFLDLLASDATGYTVTEGQPAGWMDGLDTSSVHGTIGDDVVSGVVLAPGEQTPVGRFGELAPVAVGDRVWDDLNGNGIQDPSEPGIDGVSVTLVGIDDRGAPVNRSTTTSSAAGSAGGWLIDALRPGTYTVTFAMPGMVATATTVAGGTRATDSDARANGSTASFELRANIDLVSTGSDDRDVDGGLYTPISVGDYVWRDDDLDGIQDAGEPPVDNVPVTLRHAGPDGVFGTTDDRIATTTTDSSGTYLFANVAPGSVTVVIDPPPRYGHSPQGFAAGDPTGGGANALIDSNIDPVTHSAEVLLVSGLDRADVDAGLIPKGSLGGRVWNDGTSSGDGRQGPGEPGISAVVVRLLYPDGTPVLAGDGSPLTVVSDPDGTYLFDDIVARSYIVSFDVTNGLKVTTPGVGDPTGDSDIDTKTFRTSVIVVSPLANIRHVDAGLISPIPPFLVPPSTAATTTRAPAQSTTTAASSTVGRVPSSSQITTAVPTSTVAARAVTTIVAATTTTTTGAARRADTVAKNAQPKPATDVRSRLAFTGAELGTLIMVGLALAVSGALLVHTASRRRQTR